MKGARPTKLPSHTSIQRILLALHIPKHVDSSDKHTHLLVIVAFTPVTLAEERRWAQSSSSLTQRAKNVFCPANWIMCFQIWFRIKALLAPSSFQKLATLNRCRCPLKASFSRPPSFTSSCSYPSLSALMYSPFFSHTSNICNCGLKCQSRSCLISQCHLTLTMSFLLPTLVSQLKFPNSHTIKHHLLFLTYILLV